MKRTSVILALMILMTSCTSQGMTEEEKFAAAQQTLDASSQDGGSASGGSVQVEPTQPSIPVMTPVLQGGEQQDNGAPSVDSSPTATQGVSRSNDLGDTRTYDLDNVVPLKDTCNTLAQPMEEFGSGWFEDDQLFGGGLDCELIFDLLIPQSGTYDVMLAATYAPDFGQMHLSFNRGSTNDDIFNIALYDPDVRPTGEIPLGQWHFNANEENQIVLVVYTKADESLDYLFGLDYLKLVLVQAD